MQATLLEKEAIHAKFSVQVPATEVNQAYNAILREIARQVRVPGFRPGKAPRNIIEARVGKDAIAEEVRDALIERFYPQALQKLDLLTAIHADIAKAPPVEGSDYTFEVSVELYPEVTLAAIDEIVIDTDIPTVTDDMVDQAVQQLRDENAVLIPVERPAQAGDYLLVRLASSPEASPMPVDLSKVDPKFAEQLLGKSLGDEVTIDITLPRKDDTDDVDDDDTDTDSIDADAEQANTEVDTEASPDTEVEDTDTPPETLTIVITDIKEKELPEADDELAETLGFDNWQAVVARVRDSLQDELNREARGEQREEFIEKLTENSQLELPTSMVNNRKAQLLRDIENDLGERGLDLKGYFAYLDQESEREAFEQELEQKANQDVKRDLVLAELVKQRNPTMSEAEFNNAVDMIAHYQETTPAKLRKQLGQQGMENYQFLLLRDKAVREALAELLGEDTVTNPVIEGATEQGATEQVTQTTQDSNATAHENTTEDAVAHEVANEETESA